MSFKTVTNTPSSAVATAGTLTLSYPAGTTAGSFAGYGHYLFARGLQRRYSQDLGEISISFGASDMTLTYSGATSIPAGSTVNVQLNMVGQDDQEPDSIAGMLRMAIAPTIRVDLGSPDTADANGILESQDLTAAGVYSTLAFDGVYGDPYGNLKAVLDVPRNVVAAWTTTSVMTITGKDEYGDVIVENSASGATHTGKKAFKEITSISMSISVTALTIGTGDVLGLPLFIEKATQVFEELEDNVVIPRKPGRFYIQDHMLEALIDAGTSLELTSPVAGDIVKVTTIARGTITTGGGITVEVATTAVDGLSVTVADGAVAGDIDTDTPTAGHASRAVAVGDRIEVIAAAAFNASADIFVIIEIRLDEGDQIDGTFVAGIQTLPTATTGDTKGTYNPTTTADGSTAFSLIVRAPDPLYKGVDNFDG